MLPLWGFALIYNFNNFFVYIFFQWLTDSQLLLSALIAEA